MKIWRPVHDAWRSWRSPKTDRTEPEPATPPATPPDHLSQARDSLRALLDDPQIPNRVRSGLSEEFAQIQAMLDKLEHGHIHIAVFGRVGVGKSALLNALLGEKRFSSSPLHGETRAAHTTHWRELEDGGVFLIDTPGINEVAGEDRERLAHEVAGRSDLVLFVVEGDITDTELAALRLLVSQNRPLLMVFNKIDRYTRDDRERILNSLERRTAGLLPTGRIVVSSADPAERIYIQVDEQGTETETARRPPPETTDLRERVWEILETEGKTLAALNATLFAGQLSDTLTRRVMELRRDLASALVRNYSLTKGLLVGFNPVPVTDLAAAIAVDVSLVVHLSHVYGLPLTRNEAGRLIATIAGQMTLIMGTVWTINLFSSALKGGTLGISTILTGATQGAVAYYSTFVVGEAAHRYFKHGKSWGDKGPKRVVKDILDSLDRASLLSDARDEIMLRLRSG